MKQTSFLSYFAHSIMKGLLILISVISLITLIGCKSTQKEYRIDGQYDLARSRVDQMKAQLDFDWVLEKNFVRSGESINFIAHFKNKTHKPIVIRMPQQAGVLDIDTINTVLEYSIVPIGQEITLVTPLSYFVTPYIFSNTILADEFETLGPDAELDTGLEIPNIVFVKNGEQWNESKLPPGQYQVNVSYKNLHIGYEVDREDEIRYVDISAWVGEIKGDPVTLTILP